MFSVQVSLIPSPDLASPRSLPSPPPSRISTKAQATSQELVGSNDRHSGSANELDLSPRQSKQIPHILGNKLINNNELIVKECYNYAKYVIATPRKAVMRGCNMNKLKQGKS